jgi:hypothetical protein
VRAVGGLFWDIDADDVRDYVGAVDVEVRNVDGDLRRVLGDIYDVFRVTPGFVPGPDPSSVWLKNWYAFRQRWQAHKDEALFEAPFVWGKAVTDTLNMWNKTIDFERELISLRQSGRAAGVPITGLDPKVGPEDAPTTAWSKVMKLGYIALGLGAVYVIASVVTRLPKSKP